MTDQEKRNFLKIIGYTGDYADEAIEWDKEYDTITDQGSNYVFFQGKDEMSYEPAEPGWPQITGVGITPKKHFQKENCSDDRSMLMASPLFVKLVKDGTLEEAEESESSFASTKYNVKELKTKLIEEGLTPITGRGI